jgi:hypothetical protein
VQTPEIQDQRRRDAEIHEIGERIELRPEPGGAPQGARQAAVETVEHGGGDDRDHGRLVLAVDGEPDCREAHAEREQGHEIGKDDPDRNRPKAERPRAPGVVRHAVRKVVS